MVFIIGLLTLVMVLDCLVLILLVLIQLPKKEAGAGLAFGGAATDALFGAGSGNVLTKITKYAATIFFVLAIILSVLQSNYHRRSATRFQQKLSQPGAAPVPTLPPATRPSVAGATNVSAPTNTGFNLGSTSTNAVATNAAPAATNPPVEEPNK